MLEPRSYTVVTVPVFSAPAMADGHGRSVGPRPVERATIGHVECRDRSLSPEPQRYGGGSARTFATSCDRIEGPTKIFIAGGTGAIGRVLVPLRADAGHRVVVLMRSEDRAGLLEQMGAIRL